MRWYSDASISLAVFSKLDTFFGEIESSNEDLHRRMAAGEDVRVEAVGEDEPHVAMDVAMAQLPEGEDTTSDEDEAPRSRLVLPSGSGREARPGDAPAGGASRGDNRSRGRFIEEVPSSNGGVDPGDSPHE